MCGLGVWRVGAYRLPVGSILRQGSLWVGFPMKSALQLVGSESSAVLPAIPSQSCSTPQYSGWGKNEMGLFGSGPAQLGKLGAHLYALTFPQGRNHRLRSLLALCCGDYGERVWQVKWNFVLPFSVCSILDFFVWLVFCSIGVLELLHWTPRPLQRCCCL